MEKKVRILSAIKELEDNLSTLSYDIVANYQIFKKLGESTEIRWRDFYVKYDGPFDRNEFHEYRPHLYALVTATNAIMENVAHWYLELMGFDKYGNGLIQYIMGSQERENGRTIKRSDELKNLIAINIKNGAQKEDWTKLNIWRKDFQRKAMVVAKIRNSLSHSVQAGKSPYAGDDVLEEIKLDLKRGNKLKASGELIVEEIKGEGIKPVSFNRYMEIVRDLFDRVIEYFIIAVQLDEAKVGEYKKIIQVIQGRVKEIENSNL